MGVVADGVEGGLEDAVLPGLDVLGHEEDVRGALAADFVDEAGEGGGAGEIDVGVGLDAVSIAAGDGEHVPTAGEGGDVTVFFPVAEAVEFEGVEELAEAGEEVVDEDVVAGFADAVEVPEWVVEDDEDAGEVVEGGEEIGEDGVAVEAGGEVVGGGGGEGGEAGRPGGGIGGREVVDAEVETGGG